MRSFRETSREDADSMSAEEFEARESYDDGAPRLDEATRRLIAERHASTLAALRARVETEQARAGRWERASAFHVRDDAHVTLARVWATRRAFEDAGYEVVLKSDPRDRDTLNVWIRRPASALAISGAAHAIDETEAA